MSNFISSTRGTGSISLPSSKATSYKEGQVLSGKVLGEREGKYLIQIGKHRYLAESRFNLKPGDLFKVRVAGTIDGKLHLRLLTLDRKFVFKEISKEEVMRHLLNLRLPLTDEAVEAAKVAIKYGIPLERNLLITLMSALGKGFTLAKAEAVAFLLATGLEVTPSNVRALESFLNNNVAFANYLGFIISYFKKEVLPKELKGELKSLVEDLKSMIVQAGSSKGNGAVRTALGNSLNGKTISTKMGMLASALSSYPNHEPLKVALENLSDLIRGLELINSTRNLENALYALIPASLNGKPATFELKIYYYSDEAGSRVIDPTRYRFELDVETDSLGRISYVVTVSARTVGVTAKAEDERVRELLDSHVEILKELLDQKGYTLGRWQAIHEALKRGIMEEYPLEGVDIVA